MEISEYGELIIDLNGDLEKYRGLDQLIGVNPSNMTEVEKQNLLTLCDICPEIKILDNINLNSSTVKEYKSGEKWIEKILTDINPKWSDIQKVAFIDNAIGKKISYSPNFETEVFNQGEARALWKIIDSGYGVCNGIAQVEQYILNKLDIESEMVSSGGHAFLKLNNIEIEMINGEILKGDTILDATWNLAAHRYGAKPENFCVSYEKIRKGDIKKNGEDSLAHENDEKLSNATLNLDEENLRRIFTSIGIADKEGNFPIKQLIEESNRLYEMKFSEEESIKKQLSLLAEYCPEFMKCNNSTESILEVIILNNDNLDFNKCSVNRVYERDDEKKEAVLYVYLDMPESGQIFYFADEEKGRFTKLDAKEFETRFECYEADLEKSQGMRPWETSEREEEIEDLTKSSGKIIAMEEEEK